MALLNRLAAAIGTDRFLKMLRVYPPYLGAGIALRSVDRDLTAIEVQMKLRLFNQNFVGRSHEFGMIRQLKVTGFHRVTNLQRTHAHHN